MTSLYRHLSAEEIVNWVTTADGCVHTADTTQLDSFVASASAVCIGHNEHNFRIIIIKQPCHTSQAISRVTCHADSDHVIRPHVTSNTQNTHKRILTKA